MPRSTLFTAAQLKQHRKALSSASALLDGVDVQLGLPDADVAKLIGMLRDAIRSAQGVLREVEAAQAVVMGSGAAEALRVVEEQIAAAAEAERKGKKP